MSQPEVWPIASMAIEHVRAVRDIAAEQRLHHRVHRFPRQAVDGRIEESAAEPVRRIGGRRANEGSRARRRLAARARRMQRDQQSRDQIVAGRREARTEARSGRAQPRVRHSRDRVVLRRSRRAPARGAVRRASPEVAALLSRADRELRAGQTADARASPKATRASPSRGMRRTGERGRASAQPARKLCAGRNGCRPGRRLPERMRRRMRVPATAGDVADLLRDLGRCGSSACQAATSPLPAARAERVERAVAKGGRADADDAVAQPRWKLCSNTASDFGLRRAGRNARAACGPSDDR